VTSFHFPHQPSPLKHHRGNCFHAREEGTGSEENALGVGEEGFAGVQVGGVEVGHHGDVPLGESILNLLVVGGVVHEDHHWVVNQRGGEEDGEEVGHGFRQLRWGGEREEDGGGWR